MARGFRLVPPARSASDFAQAGTAPLEIWYIAGCSALTALGATAMSAGVIRLVPFIAPARGGTLDRLGFNMTASAAGNTRIGLYDSTSEANIYPSTLLDDSGDIADSVAVKTFTVNRPLVPGNLYWLAITGSAASTFRSLAVASIGAILGSSSAMGTAPSAYMSLAAAYAPFPNPFTAGAGFSLTAAPALYYRFSA